MKYSVNGYTVGGIADRENGKGASASDSTLSKLFHQPGRLP
jgi:hypothetical protein